MGESMVEKNCPICTSKHEREQFGACEHCDEIICIDCQGEHYGQHIDPRGVIDEEWNDIE